jgi:hypothetical protein
MSFDKSLKLFKSVKNRGYTMRQDIAGVTGRLDRIEHLLQS